MSPPFLEAEVSLVFGETGIVLFKGYIRIYVPLGRFKDLGGFFLFEEWQLLRIRNIGDRAGRYFEDERKKIPS